MLAGHPFERQNVGNPLRVKPDRAVFDVLTNEVDGALACVGMDCDGLFDPLYVPKKTPVAVDVAG